MNTETENTRCNRFQRYFKRQYGKAKLLNPTDIYVLVGLFLIVIFACILYVRAVLITLEGVLCCIEEDIKRDHGIPSNTTCYREC